MAWVVDTCVILDVLENDPSFGRKSAKALKGKLNDGLVICPVSMVELAPAFAGQWTAQERFLDLCGIAHHESLLPEDIRAAHTAWHRHVTARRAGHTTKRPVADLLIGGFAMRFDGLLTRNRGDFQRWFPHLNLPTW